MKTNVSNTSLESYHKEIKDKSEVGQNEIVLQILRRHGRAMTANEIRESSKNFNGGKELPINVVSRVLHTLCKKKGILDCFEAKCNITKRTAQHYFIVVPGKQVNIF